MSYHPIKYLSSDLLPAGFTYPKSYVDFCESGATTVGPLNEDWCLLDESNISRFLSFLEKQGGRYLVPFMRRNGDDGLVCFDGSQKVDDHGLVFFTYCDPVTCWDGKMTFSEWLADFPKEDHLDDV